MKSTIIAKTAHVRIEQRDGLKTRYWVVLFYDPRGKLWGYQLYDDLKEAYTAAIKYIRRL